jgi:hypothetical protein
MSYRQSMGEITIPADLQTQTSAGRPLETVSVSVISVQCALRARGLTVGQDGKYGPETRTRLGDALRAFRRTPKSFAEYAAFDSDTRSGASRVSITRNFKTWLYSARQSCASATVRSRPGAPPSTVEEPSASDELVPDDADLGQWLPWAAGGATLLGMGAYFYFRKPGKRRKVRRNRGQRPRYAAFARTKRGQWQLKSRHRSQKLAEQAAEKLMSSKRYASVAADLASWGGAR